MGHVPATGENNRQREPSHAGQGPGILAGCRPLTDPRAMPLTPLLYSAGSMAGRNGAGPGARRTEPEEQGAEEGGRGRRGFSGRRCREGLKQRQLRGLL